MYPILLQLGPLSVRTYGVLIALACLAALQLAKWTGRQVGIPEKFLMDLAVILVFGGLLGARAFYVLLNWSYYAQQPWDILKIWQGGLVFYGGFLAAAVAGGFYVRSHKVSVGAVADCLAPPLALGQAVGRWGCFFAGCCYGKTTSLPWGVRFTDPSSLAPLGVDLHPTQIYEAIGNLFIAFILWLRLMKTRADKKIAAKGQVFWLYVVLYGISRFGMEFLRNDDRGPTIGGLYPSQIIALIAALLAFSVLMAQFVEHSEKIHGSFTENHKRV